MLTPSTSGEGVFYRREIPCKYSRIFVRKKAKRQFVYSKLRIIKIDFHTIFHYWLAGYKIRYIPEVKIYHWMGGTSVNMNSAFIQYHSFKNRINSFLKNLSLPELIKILSLHLFIINVVSFFCMISGKVEIAFSLQKAIVWNFINFRKTLVKRKIVQKEIRKVKDREINPFIKKKPKLLYYLSLSSKAKVGSCKESAI